MSYEKASYSDLISDGGTDPSNEPATPEFCCNERSDNGLCWSNPGKPCSWANKFY